MYMYTSIASITTSPSECEYECWGPANTVYVREGGGGGGTHSRSCSVALALGGCIE